MKILVVEDDTVISNLIKNQLQEAGFAVDEVHDGERAYERASLFRYDLLIVDLMLPGFDGLTLISKLREKNFQTPVLILSAKRSVSERVEGLGAGGDDYLVKPFDFAELLARVEALLRRAIRSAESSKIIADGVTIDLIKREVWREGKKLELHIKEYALLEYFMRNAGQVVTKAQILKQIWNYDFDPQTNVVDVLVFRLRAKIEKDFSGKLIQTSRGVGYVFKASQDLL